MGNENVEKTLNVAVPEISKEYDAKVVISKEFTVSENSSKTFDVVVIEE